MTVPSRFRTRHTPNFVNISMHQMWSTKHQYFACLVPKCGCSNWIDIIREQHMATADIHAMDATKFGRWA